MKHLLPSSRTARACAAGVVVCVALVTLTGVASAQSEATQAARKAVSEGVLGIKGNETPLTPTQLASRTKTLIHSIITLTGIEVDELMGKLDSLALDDEADDPLAALRDQLTAFLSDARGYLKALAVVVDDTDTLEGLQAIAGGLKNWRIGYGQRVRQSTDLIVTVQNANALDTASQRVTRVSAELQRRFKPTAPRWQPLLTQASSELSSASALIETAQVRLLDYLLAPETQKTKPSPADQRDQKNALAPSDANDVPPPPSISELARTSADHIRETYRLLIEAIKKAY